MAYQIALQPLVTTGTTPGFLELVPIEQGTCVTLAGEVICISSTGLVRAWGVRRTAKWLVGGSPALVGTAPATIMESDASFAPAVALNLSGSLIRIQCTGVAGATIQWTASISAIEVTKP
jgi:hypothetical protein